MKKISLILFLILPMLSFADNLKSWSEGLLQWSDFQCESVMQGVPSFMKANLYIEPKESIEDGKTVIKLAAVCNMDRDRSFADSISKNEMRLRFHQLQFDILESLRRDLQNDINTGMTGIQADQRVDHYNRLYAATLDKMIEQTNNGKNDQKLQEWEYLVRKNLDESTLPPVRKITQSNWKYGFYLGTGAVFPLMDVADAFSESWTFTAGLSCAYRRINAKLDISYGQPKVERLNIMNVPNQEATGTYASFLAVGFNLGYSVLDTKKFSITPHFGGTWTSYEWNVGNFEMVDGEMKLKSSESPTLNTFGWMAGIDFDYHFFTSISKKAFFLTGKREQYVSSIRVTPYIIRAVYSKANPSLNGYHIGFTIAYTGIARSLGF